jgi:hypothetical protein
MAGVRLQKPSFVGTPSASPRPSFMTPTLASRVASRYLQVQRLRMVIFADKCESNQGCVRRFLLRVSMYPREVCGKSWRSKTGLACRGNRHVSYCSYVRKMGARLGLWLDRYNRAPTAYGCVMTNWNGSWGLQIAPGLKVCTDSTIKQKSTSYLAACLNEV